MDNYVSALVAIFKAAGYWNPLEEYNFCLPWKAMQWLMDKAVEYRSERPLYGEKAISMFNWHRVEQVCAEKRLVRIMFGY